MELSAHGSLTHAKHIYALSVQSHDFKLKKLLSKKKRGEEKVVSAEIRRRPRKLFNKC